MTGHLSIDVARHEERIIALENDGVEIKGHLTWHTRLLILTLLSALGGMAATLWTAVLKH